jgi:DNA damage-binding protein 1
MNFRCSGIRILFAFDYTFDMVSPRYEDLREEISALSCTPLDPTRMFSLYVAVGFWSTYAVDLLSVASTDGLFKPVCNSISLPSLPRSLLLHDFGNAPHLLVGLRDGTLVAFTFVKNEFQDKRVFSLGTEPVGLTQFEMGEKKVVFASGGRAALFFLERGILQHSSILIKVNVTSLCKATRFNAAPVNRVFLRARGSIHRTGSLLCF